jgi:hypothetical protein
MDIPDETVENFRKIIKAINNLIDGWKARKDQQPLVGVR